MCDEADYYYSTQDTRYPRARKEHTCYACRDPVAVGQRYVYSTAISDEGLEAYKHCLRCFAMLESIGKAHQKLGTGLAIAWDLGCGLMWEEEIGFLPNEIAALAFMTPAEAEALFEAKQLPGVAP